MKHYTAAPYHISDTLYYAVFNEHRETVNIFDIKIYGHTLAKKCAIHCANALNHKEQNKCKTLQNSKKLTV